MSQRATLKYNVVTKEERELVITVEECDDSVMVWGTHTDGSKYAIVEITPMGVYLFGGFPSDFPITIDPRTQRIAVISS